MAPDGLLCAQCGSGDLQPLRQQSSGCCRWYKL